MSQSMDNEWWHLICPMCDKLLMLSHLEWEAIVCKYCRFILEKRYEKKVFGIDEGGHLRVVNGVTVILTPVDSRRILGDKDSNYHLAP